MPVRKFANLFLFVLNGCVSNKGLSEKRVPLSELPRGVLHSMFPVKLIKKMAPNPANIELAKAKLTSVNKLLFSLGVLIMYLSRVKLLACSRTLSASTKEQLLFQQLSRFM